MQFLIEEYLLRITTREGQYSFKVIQSMQHQVKWYEQRQIWRQTTSNSHPAQSPDIYRPAELTMEVCDMIGDIIQSTKGPYQPFEKKINLADLVSLVEEIWDEDD